MTDDNKQIIIERIWGDPAPVFGGEWKQRGKAWQTQRGAIRLLRSASGANISVYGNTNSGFAGQRYDVFTYLQDNVLHTSDFWETLKTCAERYGVDLKYSKEQAEKIQRQRLAREVAPSLIASLSENREGSAWKYLVNVRGIEPDGVHFGELTPESIRRAKDALKARGLTCSPEDWQALGLSEQRAQQGYNVVLPYYRNGVVTGFVLRNVRPDCESKDRYRYSNDLGRGGYCDRLTDGQPATFVEGQFDAIRLICEGFTNVIAMGGANMGDEIARLLDTHEIHQVTYIPDLEYNEQGEKKTKLITDAVKAFQAANVDGERVITHLYIAEIPTPEGATLSGLKIDADTYGKEQGGDALRTLAASNVDWWGYELGVFEKWVYDSDTVQRGEFERRFMDIYNRCATPIERERLRQYIDGNPQLYAEQGITRAALLDVDAMHRQTEYNNRIKEGAKALTAAVENGANPATIGDILAKMSETQSTNTRDEWEKQLTATFDDELKAIQEQPDTIRTRWELGTIAKDKNNPAVMRFHRWEYIEFYPADITVFCAPTSHGKTMILFQSALDLIRSTEKTYLYVSCEENSRQLLERAINVYLDIETTETGRDNLNNYCFVSGTRKRAIKAALRGGYPPEGYNTAEHWERLSARIKEGVRRYGEQVRPRLKLIHTEGSAESIAANVLYYVEQYRAQGVDVGGVFVDYMQLLTSDNSNAPRNIELKDICKALKECAARTELPVIVAAQLNRYAIAEGVDAVTVANLGEGADIERIAHDIYLIWQTDKTKTDMYYKNVYAQGDKDKTQEPTRALDYNKVGERSRRIFKKTGSNEIELKRGYLYVEQMKARDGRADGWGLLPFDGERGQIGNNDIEKMIE